MAYQWHIGSGAATQFEVERRRSGRQGMSNFTRETDGFSKLRLASVTIGALRKHKHYYADRMASMR